MAGLPTLAIGGLTISVLQRLPDFKFKAPPVRTQSGVRSQTGRLFLQRSFTKYEITITGLAQTLFADLRFLYEQDDAIDLYSIADRKEHLGLDSDLGKYVTTRRVRLDDNAVSPTIEWPEGSVLAGNTYSIVNGTTNARITFTSLVPGATPAVIRYFPIIQGYITELDSDYDLYQDEEPYSLTFSEG